MKTIKLIIILFFLVSCAAPQQIYNLRPNGTQNDFTIDMTECSKSAGVGGGGFVFGPIWLVGIATAAYTAINYSKQFEFQKCMELKGYVCTKNCR